MKTEDTFWVRVYPSGPIEVAKQLLRAEVLSVGLCVTIEPTLFIYSGGEESGYVVGLINYPRFPASPEEVWDKAEKIAHLLMLGTSQWSALAMSPQKTAWITQREGKP